MNTRDLLFSGLDLVKQQASAVASTVSLANQYLPARLTGMNTGDIVAGLSYVKNHTAAMVSTRDGAVGTAAMVIGGAVGAYFLWP
uniref:Uncharacterized protein n=1 Tax=Aegilops tauschii subsp. strangulata TaxID=200361 RepID=A0A453B4X3_AEGTS